ncbi:MAG: TrkH family potassium uptake protein [Mariprofundales bacterium]
MHSAGVLWTLGILTSLYGISMLLPAMVDLYYHSGHALHFLLAGLAVVSIGYAMMHIGKKPDDLSHRDGFMIVALAWVVLAIMGAVPFLTSEVVKGSVLDALFESTSGLTTTGATILSDLDDLPPSILFWRSMQEWLGGMGIIVLAVAVMPLLGVGGMQLFRAETPGPVKDKLTARVTETAKMLWYIYLGMTALAALFFWLAGMTSFDAINHAMCTIAIGGFSTHDASFGYYESSTLRLIAVVFMFMAGINFTLHFAAMRRGFSLRGYFSDDEFRHYAAWLLFLIITIAILSWFSDAVNPDLVEIIFNTVSVATTTGFAVSDYGLWPAGTHMLLLLAMFIGACAGSTGGGMKVIRILLLVRQGMREIRLLIHPHAVIRIKAGGRHVKPRILQALWGFFALYLLCFAVISIVVAAAGVDLLTAISASAACITNTGPGLAGVGPMNSYANLPDLAKVALMFAMLLGRLEIFTFFVLLVPEFWRR